MTATQLNAKKLDIIGMVMNTNEEKAVTTLWNVAREMTDVQRETSTGRIPGLPCTLEERIASVCEGLEDIHAGRTYSMDEVFKPYEKWL